eukprot:4927998-Prymnesium_polylepis.1
MPHSTPTTGHPRQPQRSGCSTLALSCSGRYAVPNLIGCWRRAPRSRQHRQLERLCRCVGKRQEVARRPRADDAPRAAQAAEV